jgi:hypothetical protein
MPVIVALLIPVIGVAVVLALGRPAVCRWMRGCRPPSGVPPTPRPAQSGRGSPPPDWVRPLDEDTGTAVPVLRLPAGAVATGGIVDAARIP